MNGTPVQNNVNIYVNTGDAQVQMDALNAKFESQTKKLADLTAKQLAADEARKSGNADAQKTYQSLSEQIKKVEKQMNTTSDAITIQSKKLSGELSPTVQDLQKAMNNLIAVQKRMGDADGGMNERKHQIEQYRAALDHTAKSAGLVSEKLKESHHESKGFAESIKEIAAGFTIAGAIEKTGEALKEFFSESIKEILAMKEGQDQLRNSLEGVGRVDALEKLNGQAEEFSKKFSYLYTPEITKVQEKLVTFGRLSMNQINEVLPVIINFAAKTKQSMQESATTILSAMEGNGRALKQFGLEIVKDGTFVQNYGLVMNQLAKRVDGAAETFDKSGSGSLARYTKNMKELQEAVGSFAIDSFVDLTDGVSRLMNNFRELISTQKDEKSVLLDLQSGMNENLTALQNTNLSSEARKLLIQETNEKYGEYLPQLLTEKDTLEKIKQIQEESNKAFQMKIYMIAYQKELTEILEAQRQSEESKYKLEMEQAKLNSASSKTQLSAAQLEDKNKLLKGIQQVNKEIIDGTDKAKTEVEDKYKSMIQSMGASWSEFQKMLNEGDKHNNDKSLRDDQGIGKKERQKLDKELEAWKKFYEQIQTQQDEADNKALSANDKELAELENKFHKEQEQLKQFLADGTITKKQFEETDNQIRLQYNQELNAVLDKQEKAAVAKRYEDDIAAQKHIYDETREIQKRALSLREITEAEYAKRIGAIDLAELQAKELIASKYSAAVKKAADDQLTYTIQANEQVDKNAQLQAQRTQQIIDFIRNQKKITLTAEGKDADDSAARKLEILAEQYAKEYQLFKDNAEAIKALNEAYAAQAAKIMRDEWQSALKKVAADIQKVAQAATSIISAVSQMQKNNDEVMMARERKRTATAIKSYDAQLAAHRISQERHDKLVEAAQMALAKKEDNLKRKQFDNDKKMKTVSATIDMATGIMNALATAPSILAGIAMAAVVAATGAVQIAEIQSQQYVSSMGDGGWIGGDKHSDPSGGTLLIDRKTKNPLAMAERGEYIVPADAAAHNPDLLRKLSNEGRKGNISDLMLAASQVNAPQAISNIRNSNASLQRQVSHSDNGGAASSNSINTSHIEQLLKDTMSIHEHTLEIHKQILKKPVTVSLRHIQEAEYKQSVILKKNL